MSKIYEEPLRKITVKKCYGTPRVKVGDTLRIMRVGGRVTSCELVESLFGESTKFKGDFRAYNLRTGEVFRSRNCFLPGVAEDAIAGAFDGDPIEFVFDIAVKGVEKKDGSEGYEYGIKPVVALEVQDDPLHRLFEQGEQNVALPDFSKVTENSEEAQLAKEQMGLVEPKKQGKKADEKAA